MKRYCFFCIISFMLPAIIEASNDNCIPDQVVADNDLGCTYLHEGTSWDPLIPDTCSLNMLKSTFDTDADGWTKHTPSDAGTNLVWYSTGGNPDGYIRLNDAAQGVTDWFAAPAKFLGNKSQFYGGVLKFDMKHSLNLTGSQVGVRFIGNGITIQATINRPNQTWQTYSIPLAVGSWTVQATGSLATQEEILQVLSNILTFNIHGDWRSGVEQTSLDNVMMRGGSIYYELLGATSGTGTTLNGVVFNPGITTVTWTITDACLNISYCTFTVTIPGNETCEESETVIFMSNTVVDSCDRLVLIAGQSIFILPDSHVKYGGRFLAKIDNGGDLCNNFRSITNVDDAIFERPDNFNNQDSNLFFRVFPNPTYGILTLELSVPNNKGFAEVEIFNMIGSRIISDRYASAGQYIFDLSSQKAGLYLIRVAVGLDVAVEKIIKQ